MTTITDTTPLPDATTLPDTSTLTDRALAASADRVLRVAQAMGRPHRHDHDLAVAWQGDRGWFTNLAYVLAEPEHWDDVLARIAAVVPTDRPASLVTAASVPDLSALGWELAGHPPLMIRPVGQAAPQVPAELVITEVVDESGLEEFERTLIDAFPEPQMLPYRRGEWTDGRVLGGPTRFFTGSVAGRPVATAAGHVAAGVNLVEMVATMPSARGRGYGAALTTAASTLDPTLPPRSSPVTPVARSTSGSGSSQ